MPNSNNHKTQLMKNLLRITIVLLLGTFLSTSLWAQRTREHTYVKILLTPNHADWNYKLGEKPEFTVSVLKDNFPQKNVDVTYEWGPDMLKAIKTGSLNTGDGYRKLTMEGINKPGFMTLTARVKVNGINYANYIKVAFAPDQIEPFAQMPADFDKFWEETLSANRRTPLEPVMTLLPEYCTSKMDAYHIRFRNGGTGCYIYGMLSIPKGEGPFPAVLQVPGAGVRGYVPDRSYAEAGAIVLKIGIHGIPVDLPAEVYNNLRLRALKGYYYYNIDNREKYYYRNVYAGCVRAVDFLCTLPQIDKERIAVCGGSQGGALSIVTAALDPRIKCLWANYPALCDLAGYYRGGTGGWPHIFRDPNETNLETKIKVSEYYDVVNFARKLKVPILFCTGYNDATCPPTSTLGTYNEITAPKELRLTLDAAHWTYPETNDYELKWLIRQLNQ